MQHSVLFMMSDYATGERIKKLVDWEAFGFRKPVIEYHAALGLRRLMSLEPEIVILDVKSPLVELGQFIALMRKQAKELFVILYDEKEMIAGCPAGADAILKSACLTEAELSSLLLKACASLENGDKTKNSVKSAKPLEEIQTLLHGRPGLSSWSALETLFDQWEGFAVLMVDCENPAEAGCVADILERFYGPRTALLPEGRKLCIISESDDAMELERLLREKWHKRFVCCCGFASNVEELPVAFQETQALLQNCIYFGIEGILADSAYFKKHAQGLSADTIDLGLRRLTRSLAVGDEKAVEACVNDLFLALKNSLDMEKRDMLRQKLEDIFTLFSMGKESPAIEAHATLQEEASCAAKRFCSLAASLDGNEQRWAGVVIDAALYIAAHYSQDVSLAKTAGQVGIAPTYLSFLFQRELHVSYIDFLTRVRIRNAKYLLRESGETVGAVAEMVGIRDQRYFSRMFKKHTGMTPTEYRKSVLGERE